MLDKARVRLVMKAIEDVVRDKAKELGLDVENPRCTFSSTELNLRIKLVDASADAQEQLAVRVIQDAKLLGLNKCVGDIFSTLDGKQYTITGIVMRRRKYPVTVKGPQGGQYKMTVAMVNAGQLVVS